MLDQALLLAPELTYMMLAIYFYPLTIALVHVIFRMNSIGHSAFLKSQTMLASSVVVSLGLIGTFQGLTMMVTAIAGSMAGDGDITEKMGAMISSISEALSAMSYAFLTSIFGVAISVLLLISHNCWNLRYVSEYTNTEDEELILVSLEKLNEISEKLYNRIEISTIDEKHVEALCAHLKDVAVTNQNYQKTVLENINRLNVIVDLLHEESVDIPAQQKELLEHIGGDIKQILNETKLMKSLNDDKQTKMLNLYKNIQQQLSVEKHKIKEAMKMIING